MGAELDGSGSAGAVFRNHVCDLSSSGGILEVQLGTAAANHDSRLHPGAGWLQVTHIDHAAEQSSIGPGGEEAATQVM